VIETELLAFSLEGKGIEAGMKTFKGAHEVRGESLAR